MQAARRSEQRYLAQPDSGHLGLMHRMMNSPTSPPANQATGPLSHLLSSRLAIGKGGWWPVGATLAFDFANDQYMAGQNSIAAFSDVPGVSVTRATSAWALTSQNVPIAAGLDQALIVPQRGLVSEAARTRLNPLDVTTNTFGTGANTSVSSVQTILPDGASGTAYRLVMPATGSTFLNLSNAIASGFHSIQAWVKQAGVAADARFGLGVGALPIERTSTQDWQLFRLEQSASGLAATINNRFDLFATDVLVIWPDVQQGPLSSPILAPGQTAVRAAATITVADISSHWGLPPDHTFEVIYEDDSTTTLTAVAGDLTIPVSAKAYRSILG